jgi:hypothetical protein
MGQLWRYNRLFSHIIFSSDKRPAACRRGLSYVHDFLQRALLIDISRIRVCNKYDVTTMPRTTTNDQTTAK